MIKKQTIPKNQVYKSLAIGDFYNPFELIRKLIRWLTFVFFAQLYYRLVSDFPSKLKSKCDVTSCSAIQRHNWRSLMSAQPPLGLRNIGWNSISPTRETSRSFGKRNSFVEEEIFSTCLTIDSSLQALVYRWIPLKNKVAFFRLI